MLVEAFATLVLLWSGVAILRLIGLRGWPLVPLGFLVGIANFVAVNYVFIIFGLKYESLYTLTALFATTTAAWLVARLRSLDVSIPAKGIVVTFIATLLLIFILREANLVKFHFDSYRYLVTGSLIGEGNLEFISPNLITKRFSSVSIIHSPASISNELYLRSITPLISLSILGTIFWLTEKGLSKKLPRKVVVIYGLLAALVLATNNRYIWHSFYINGHLLFAGYLLLSCGSGWLLTNKTSRTHAKKLVLLQMLSIIGLVFTRPEAPFFAVISILPTVVSESVNKKYKSILISVLGLSILIQSWPIVLFAVGANSKIALEHKGFILMGVLLLIASVLIILVNDIVVKFQKHLIWLIELGILAALLLLFVKKPNILIKSVVATVHNAYLGVGLWGWSIIVLTILIAIIMIVYNSSKNISLRLAVTTFMPLSFVLAYLREGAYRISVNDSLNRMIIQVIPVLVLFIVVSVAAGNIRHFWRSRITAPEEAKTL